MRALRGGRGEEGVERHVGFGVSNSLSPLVAACGLTFGGVEEWEELITGLYVEALRCDVRV